MSLYNQDAEQAIIGGIFLTPDTFFDASEIIQSKDFYSSECRAIFDAMQWVSESNQEIDPFVVSDVLEQTKGDNDWSVLCLTFLKNCTSSLNVVAYAKAVKQYSMLRRMYYATQGVMSVAVDQGLVLEQRFDQFRDALTEILNEEDEQDKGPISLAQAMPEVIAKQEEYALHGGGVTGLRTGFSNIDNRTGGLKGGDLIVIAARPSMGKTNMALNISKNVAIDQQKPVFYASLEMMNYQLIERMASNDSGVDYGHITGAKMSQLDRDCFKRTCIKFEQCENFILDETGNLSLSALVSRAKRIHHKHNLELMVVDHGGLIDAPGDNDTAKYGKISRTCKELAKSLNIPLILLMQCNRGCEQRINKRPIMSDLRASGRIEEDADMVCFVYRDAV